MAGVDVYYITYGIYFHNHKRQGYKIMAEIFQLC